MPILSALIVLPVLAALVLLFLPDKWSVTFRSIAVGVAAIQVGLASQLYLGYQSPGFQFIEKHVWFRLPMGEMGQVNINYLLGADGLSISIVMMSAIVLLIAAFASPIKMLYTKGYYALFLILNSAIMGTFLALDLFLFFLFFEFMLLPMYFLIGIWGGANRSYASIKFFLYTLLGSVLILIVIIGLSNATLDPIASLEQFREGTGQDISIDKMLLMVSRGDFPEQYWVRTFSFIDMLDKKNAIITALLGSPQGIVAGINARWLAFLLFESLK
jgi:NADH-quinone oxidoreductase subunit M